MYIYIYIICLPPQGTPPPTQQLTWLIAHTAHNQHCGHTALPPGQKYIYIYIITSGVSSATSARTALRSVAEYSEKK